MSSANNPPTIINFLASSAQNTLVPATPLNSNPGTSLVILKRPVTFTEIVFSLPAGIYDFNANCQLNIANLETSCQQIELQIVRLTNAGGGAVQYLLASVPFTASRNFANATFATIVNVDYTLQCTHSNIDIPDGIFFGIRCLINGNPVGGSTISDATFVATKKGDIIPTTIFLT
jgi:hypothetical protein